MRLTGLRIAFTIVCYLSILLVNAQIDTSSFEQKLKFGSAFEEEAFYNLYKTDSDDYIKLLLGIDDKQDIKSFETIKGRIDSLVNKLKSSNIENKPIDKRVNKIYKETHKTFLKKYQLVVNFDKIFETGRYNCVSATALYAIMFDKFNIKYTIKETTNHVYIIADPGGKNILVETTLSKGGDEIVSEKIKADYVKYLRDYKLLTTEEINNYSSNELFNRYYYTDVSISLLELTGLQYYNDGLMLLKKEDFKAAFEQLAKSNRVYRNERNLFLINICLLNLINKENIDIKDLPDYLSSLAYYNEAQRVKEYIEYSVHKVAHTYLIDKPDTASYKKFYDNLKSGIFEAELIREIDFIHHYYFGSYYLLKGKYSQAINSFEKSYLLNKQNLEQRAAIIESIGRYLSSRRDYQSALDSLKSYGEKFPFISDDDRIQQMYVALYMQSMGDNFEMNDKTKAEYYLTEFEEFMAQHKTLEPDGDAIGYGFGCAFGYFVRKHNYKLAKEYLNIGLKYAPYSTELHRKESVLKEYLKD